VELVLTCGSWQEAQAIADELLGQKLVACVEFLDVASRYHWKNKVEHASEVKLIMTTIESLFEPIEFEVKKLHSYETFVLKAIPLTHVSSDASLWLASTTSQKIQGN
jgi:periplasmic divalent cation tolerance protein